MGSLWPVLFLSLLGIVALVGVLIILAAGED